MAVGVTQIQRLADEVVGEAVERHAVADGVGQPRGQLAASRQEQREVVQAGEAARGARTRLHNEHDELTPPGAERRPRAAALAHLETDGAPVVVERAVQVGDREVHRADGRARRQLRAGYRGAGLELLRVAGADVGTHLRTLSPRPSLAHVEAPKRDHLVPVADNITNYPNLAAPPSMKSPPTLEAPRRALRSRPVDAIGVGE
jgi:hypothetical protein